MSDVASPETGRDVRHAARAGFDGLTVGRAAGFVQTNLVLLPARNAQAFEDFCRANPTSCPLVARGDPGDPAPPALGADLDLRTDLPAYLVHEQGSVRGTNDLLGIWRDDLVAFAIGCWFGAEAALRRAGVRLRHVELGLQGPLFRTGRRAVPTGCFRGPLVVSMRPFADRDVETVVEVTSRLPLSHGAPIHRGDPTALGIRDPDRPDWGEPLRLVPGETALYWGCGLTALAALQAAALPFFVTHAPGAMLVTDPTEAEPACP